MNVIEAIRTIVGAMKELEWGEQIEKDTMAKLRYIDEWCKKNGGKK